MKTVKQIIQFLEQYPEDSIAYAYEGESTCIVVKDKYNREQLGYIDCPEPHTNLEDPDWILSLS